MTTCHPQLKWDTGDNFLNLLASVAAQAFTEAEKKTLARAELRSLFDLDTLDKLYRLGLISWDPYDVRELPAQMEMAL